MIITIFSISRFSPSMKNENNLNFPGRFGFNTTFLFSTSPQAVKELAFPAGNKRKTKRKYSAFIIIKNYWNRFIIKKVTDDNVSHFDNEKTPPFWNHAPPLPSNKEGKSGVLLQKRRMFSIMKVRYIITRNFFDNEPISIIFDDYESWVFPFPFSFVSSRKG